MKIITYDKNVDVRHPKRIIVLLSVAKIYLLSTHPQRLCCDPEDFRAGGAVSYRVIILIKLLTALSLSPRSDCLI